jgi:hypothetical protein
MLVVGLVIAAGVLTIIFGRPWTHLQAPELEDITGEVNCVSGAAVAGAFIAVADSVSASRFAQWHADPANPARASYASVVPAGSRYAVHVGCGHDGSAWSTDNWSPVVSGHRHSFTCDDQLALGRHEHFGTCRGA